MKIWICISICSETCEVTVISQIRAYLPHWLSNAIFLENEFFDSISLFFFFFLFFYLFLLWKEIESSHLYEDLRWAVCARLRVRTSRRRNIILERHLTFSPSFFLFSSFLFRTKTGAVYIIAVLQYLRARRASIVADLTIIIALARDARNEKDKQRQRIHGTDWFRVEDAKIALAHTWKTRLSLSLFSFFSLSIFFLVELRVNRDKHPVIRFIQ